MLVVCSWCQRQGLPTFLREVEPYTDTALSHSICPLHADELRARLRAVAEAVRAQQERPRQEGRTP